MVFSFLRRWRERGRTVTVIPKEVPPESPDDESWFFPPEDVHDHAAWNRYWQNQVSHGLTPPLFDLFCNDAPLIQCLRKRGGTSVLCVGNGISQEPRALAAAGFDVTGIDLSPIAIDLAQMWEFDSEELDRFCKAEELASGGSAAFVVGDILDGSLCPGLFDAIIERRTLQLFPEQERGAALDCLISRIQPNGLFLSHCHDGRWKPPAEPVHRVERLFRDRGWPIFPRDVSLDHPGHMAWLVISTG